MDVEEVDLGDSLPSDTKKSTFEKKLELSGLEDTYDPTDVRWKQKVCRCFVLLFFT